MRTLIYSLLIALTLLASPGQAAIEVLKFDNPEQEQRFKALAEELRCLVCQNQNIADSNADLAQDLRREIHEMITAGLSDKEITNFMVERYGDFVLYRPPVKATTLALWAGPFIIFLIALGFLIYFIRYRGITKEEGALSVDESTRLSGLVETGKEETK